MTECELVGIALLYYENLVLLHHIIER